MSALDQPGDIGNHEASLGASPANQNHSQMRFQRSEWVVGDFWASGGNARNQRRFANVGISHQRDVGEQFQLEPESSIFPGTSIFVFLRRLMCGSGEPRIATSTAATACDDNTLVGLSEVVDLVSGIGVVDDGSDWDF